MYLLGNAELDDTAKFVSSLFGRDAMDGKAALHVVDQTELLVRLLHADHVHEAGREVFVRSHLAVNLHQTLKLKN